MKGSISHDTRGGCQCGGVFGAFEKIDIYKIPKCSTCGKYPDKFRVVRNLPGLGKKQIRFFAGKRISDPFGAIYCMKRIDEEIESGTFKMQSYLSEAELERRTFSSFVDELIKEREEKVKENEIAFEGHRRFKSIIRNHLVGYFGKMRIDAITGVIILAYQKQLDVSENTESKALSTLRTILNSAYQMGVIESMPAFPRIKKTRHRKSDFIDIKSQQKIIDEISNPVKKAALRLGSLFAMRPCEIRALKWSDIDFEHETVTIQRHYSGNQLLAGRKSQGSNCPYAVLELPFISIENMKPVVEILKDIPRGELNDFVFTTSTNKSLSERDLYKAWIASYERLGLDPDSRPDLYSGTRHATGSALYRAGVPLDIIRELFGQTTRSTTERYAKANSKFIKECVESAGANVATGKVLEMKRKLG